MTKKNIYKHRINGQIKAFSVRVIFQDINRVMSLDEALTLAEENSLDLVEFGPGPSPTCKILDYSKYRYQEEKKQKLQDQINRVKIKEILLRPSIDKGDLDIKMNQMKSFLSDGSEVRVKLKLRGREKSKPKEHFSFLASTINSFISSLNDSMKIDVKENLIGATIILKPIKKN